MRNPAVLAVLLPWLMGAELLQTPSRTIESGNGRFKAGKPEEALAEYDKAVKVMPGDPGVHFNRGAALYSLKRYEEAKDAFLRATEARAMPLKGWAFYNLGNSFFGLEKYDDAIGAYRRALALDPGDMRAKWNLELALKKRQEKQEQQKQDQKQDQQQQQKNDDQQQQQKNDDQQQKQDQQQQKQDQQQKPEDQQQKQDQQQQQQQQQQANKPEPQKKEDKQPQPQPQQGKEGEKPPEKAPDMREIDAVLDSLERSPKDLEKVRARLRAIRRAPPSKDW